uniref:Uncharacterized protein n=1 Tax=Steinernema glaseri TaxID=37863 RepID=A0A1I7YBV6_9BILA
MFVFYPLRAFEDSPTDGNELQKYLPSPDPTPQFLVKIHSRTAVSHKESAIRTLIYDATCRIPARSSEPRTQTHKKVSSRNSPTEGKQTSTASSNERHWAIKAQGRPSGCYSRGGAARPAVNNNSCEEASARSNLPRPSITARFGRPHAAVTHQHTFVQSSRWASRPASVAMATSHDPNGFQRVKIVTIPNRFSEHTKFTQASLMDDDFSVKWHRARVAECARKLLPT